MISERRSYFFGMLLYPDDSSHKAFFDNLNTFGFKWCGILHDKDCYKDDTEINGVFHSQGELKKPHWHLFIRLQNAKTLSAFQRLIGAFDIAPNYAEYCDEYGLMRYLLHTGCPDTIDKYKYDPSELLGSRSLYNQYMSDGSDDFDRLRECLEKWSSDDDLAGGYTGVCAALNEAGLLKIASSNFLLTRMVNEYIEMKGKIK